MAKKDLTVFEIKDYKTYDKEGNLNEGIRELNIDKYIELVRSASHSEVLDYISKSKAIILLSRYEGQSMFVTESISLGKPLILTSGNGMSDLIIDGLNGFLTKVGDSIETAKVLSKVMELDQNQIKKMGEKSREIYNRNFSQLAVYNQFDCLMELRDRN